MKVCMFNRLKYIKITTFLELDQDYLEFIVSTPKYVQRFGCSTHSHNTYIQLLVETGVIGFLFFLSIFLLISYYFFKHAYSNFFYKKPIFNDYQIFLLIAVFITLWPLSPSANFFSNSISVIYFYPLGFLLKSFYKD